MDWCPLKVTIFTSKTMVLELAVGFNNKTFQFILESLNKTLTEWYPRNENKIFLMR